jgi:hypothetical protein
MGIAEIIGLTLSLVATYGPKAVQVFQEWQAGVGGEPTEVDWQKLREKIALHNPDTY